MLKFGQYQYKLRYSWYGQMSQGQMLRGQMSPWQLESVLNVPRKLPLKFHQNRVSNNWYIANIEFLWWWWGGMQRHFRVQPMSVLFGRWGWGCYKSCNTFLVIDCLVNPCFTRAEKIIEGWWHVSDTEHHQIVHCFVMNLVEWGGMIFNLSLYKATLCLKREKRYTLVWNLNSFAVHISFA